MKLKLTVIVVTLLGGALMVAWAQQPCLDTPTTWPCRGWTLGGTWTQSVPPTPPMTPGSQPAIIYETLCPVDPAGDVLIYKQTYASADMTLGAMFPEADLGGEAVGTAARTGPNEYRFSIIGYIGQSQDGTRGKILGIMMSSGTMTLTDADTRIDSNIVMSVYSPDADVNPADGQPDEGVEPIICMPFPGEYMVKRMPIKAACIPQ